MKRIPNLVWHRNEVPEELHGLLDTLGAEYPITNSGRGIKLEFQRIDEPETTVKVARTPRQARIEYTSVATAARGIGAVLSGLDGREATPFKMLGIMLDISRNMVMRPEHLKKWLRRLALSGYNLVMLYAEDTYCLPDEPFFGYMRGGYTMEELQDLDAYAQQLGIELVGCIQTLGHLAQILRWNGAYGQITDTNNVLLVDEPKTYELIEKMITFWSKALGSHRIHIGMDEAHSLGRGRFIDHNGFEQPFELFNRHLTKVNEICARHGLAPMLWSDMYFRLSNPEQLYRNSGYKIPEAVQRKIPRNVQLVFWDYGDEKPELYEEMLEAHREIGFEPVMASGIWTWRRLWYDHTRTRSAVVPCLEACRKLKVQELFFTMWGDDGGYCNYDSALAGLVYASDLAFGMNPDDTHSSVARFATICGGNFQTVTDAGGIQAWFGEGDQKYDLRASIVIWDDPLLGIYFNECKLQDPDFAPKLLQRYRAILAKVRPLRHNRIAGDFGHMYNILTLLIRKIELRLALEKAYQNRNRTGLRKVATVLIPATITAVREFDESFRTQWLECAKPFGLEVIQHRNASLIARLEETARRIGEYLDGKIPEIDELMPTGHTYNVFNNLSFYRDVCAGTVLR